MTSADKDGYKRQAESERAWLRKPLTTGAAIALLGANVLVLFLIALYLAHRLDQLDVYVGSISGG